MKAKKKRCVCGFMAVEMVDEMFRGLEDADREWRDEKAEEVDYL